MGIVLFNATDKSDSGTVKKLIPGPLSCADAGFLSAYESMAERGGAKLYEALEMRYDQVKKLKDLFPGDSQPAGGWPDALKQKDAELKDCDDLQKKFEELKAELDLFGSPAGEKDTEARREWFRNWQASHADRPNDAASADDNPMNIIRLLHQMQNAGPNGGTP